MTEKPAKNAKGHILFNPKRQNKYFFRIYEKNGSFKDYDLNIEELKIEILSDNASFYESKDKKTLDWCSKAIGRKQ